MHNDTIEKITEFLFIGLSFDKLEKYDLVIVLGNNLYQEVALAIQKMYDGTKINDNTLIVLSGNKGTLNADITRTEAELINEEIHKLALPLNIVLEKRATNTKENLLFTKEYLQDLNKYEHILIICKSYLGRRALMCADALDYPLDKIDIYGVSGENNKANWFKNPASRKRILEELERISEYTLKGDLKM